MKKKLFLSLICLIVYGVLQAKAPKIWDTSDTSKILSEEAAAEHYQPLSSINTLSPKKHTQPSLHRPTTSHKHHYGKRLRTFKHYLQPQQALTMIWIGVGILIAALLIGTGMMLQLVSFLGAFISLAIITLVALVLPFVESIGIEENFVLGAILFFFGIAMIFMGLGVVALWAGGTASIIEAGAFVISWSLLSFAFAIGLYFALYILWKLLKAFFRLIILVFTFGLVDIGK
ncbi:hypothetical protein [uncultured Microscilla sp.]|uniref:hypothetical protein n=1 Tax=uncultured Microscilla sp. TaxID=432653 RepID=UPI002623E614|nr:hypothetical protein [uncultured Microscilla sp.]